MFSNPVRLTDPTGMTPEIWIPDEKGNLISENNDNAETLPKNYGISMFTSCDRGTAGKTIRNSEGNDTSHIKFDQGVLRNESTLTDINNLVPRKSIARFAYSNGSARHGAVYYGKSNDGTKCFYTKDGVDSAPRITTLNSIISNYGKPKGLKVQKDFIGRIKDWWNDAPATYESGFYTRN